MKRKNVKKVLAIALTASMSLGTFAGASAAENTEEPVVITVLTDTNAAFGDWNDYYVMEQIERDLNIDLQIEMVPGDIWAEKSALYFASDELPDIIFGNIDASLYGTQGYLLDMSEYVSEELTPNLYSAFEQVPDLRRACTELDGSIYRVFGYDAKMPEQMISK